MQKFPDDTAIVACVGGGGEMEHRNLVVFCWVMPQEPAAAKCCEDQGDGAGLPALVSPPTASHHRGSRGGDCGVIQVPWAGDGQQTGLVTEHRRHLLEGTKQAVLSEVASFVQRLHQTPADVLPGSGCWGPVLRCGLGRQHQEERQQAAKQDPQESGLNFSITHNMH